MASCKKIIEVCEALNRKKGTPSFIWDSNPWIEDEMKRLDDMFIYEMSAMSEGVKTVAGVDEAGRGPMAGPVVACAVLIEDFIKIPGVSDSKKLDEKTRSALYPIIIRAFPCHALGIATSDEIDSLNIHNASLLAMKRAVSALPRKPGKILVDGKFTISEMFIPQTAVIKGDSLCYSIALASILAKVTRDRLMIEYDTEYPGYGFAIHKGYCTSAHVSALKKLGPCPIHRATYGPVKEAMENRRQKTPRMTYEEKI